MQSEIAALEHAVQTYLDGVHEGDAAKLGRVFHPLSHLYTATPGKVVDYRAPDWIESFSQRPSPKAKGEPRGDAVLSIDFNGPAHAFVKLNCAVPPYYFTDYLTFVKSDGRWQIIAKAYHYDIREG